ncbi:hypothetical protein K458DRAFT_423883 [Lentithecium fluviatile CBS 122367]|uniref:Uncharacterized protein n=1 Tax=Lentithecium fluviatile CBS 122367 TaxID=1168545 RepID=A0A6G1IHL3_9PLEO|nr:hypothetical protein K458DRAFT_423883 [Lentithecium fluviatile CBS 122367]
MGDLEREAVILNENWDNRWGAHPPGRPAASARSGCQRRAVSRCRETAYWWYGGLTGLAAATPALGDLADRLASQPSQST